LSACGAASKARTRFNFVGRRWRELVVANAGDCMKPFTDQSTANRTEKAKRVLRALANPHDYKYFFGDGFPRHEALMQDAAAALEVLEDMERKAHKGDSALLSDPQKHP
jgi:hypothetical protein